VPSFRGLTLPEKTSLITPLGYKILRYLADNVKRREWFTYEEISRENNCIKCSEIINLLYDLRLIDKEEILGKDSFRLNFSGLIVVSLKELYARGIIERAGSVIGTGKESIVMHGETKSGEKVVIKSHVLRKSSFRNSRKYRSYAIGRDMISASIMGASIEAKALEMVGLAGGHVPKFYGGSRNSIVMQFIDGRELYKVKDKIQDPEEVFWQIAGTLRIAFKEVGLIHGDLSEYNVMYSMEEGKAYVIDWPQAKSVKERDHDVYLSKDIKKLVNFFNKNYKLAIEEEEVIEYIKGD